jgi:outer membrane receptor protein involved in Fe transport
MRSMRIFGWVGAVLLLCWCTAGAQDRGTIKGRVFDTVTKEGLPVVNVKVKGTYYGAATDFDGNFVILNITAGSYTLEFTIVGHTPVQRTDVRVQGGKTTEVNQGLNETVLSLGQEVVVVGEKPLVNLEETSSKRSVNSEDLKATAITDVTEIVSQQVGVVETDNEIHIRGGRASENAYLVEGVSVQDPLAGTGFGLQLSAEAIEEIQVITGGYNAEYGQATSGVVNVSVKDGGPKYAGSLAFKHDAGSQSSFFRGFGGESYEFTLGGPEPITSYVLPALGIKDFGDVTFFTNFYGGFSNDIFGHTAHRLNSSTFYGTRFAPKEENNWFWLAKVTWKPTPLFRVTYSFNQSVTINQNSQSLQTNLEYVEPSPGYQYEFSGILDSANTYTHNNQLHSLAITHTLSNTTFYELKWSRFYTNLRTDANGLDYTQYREPKDIVTFPIVYFNRGRDTIGVIPGDGFYDLGNGFTWHDHYVIENSLKFDLTHTFSEQNRFKAGFDATFQKMQNIDIYQPWAGTLGLNNDVYLVYPAFGSLYAQDNITFSGMILNVGLRFDYWFPGDLVDQAVGDTNVITIPAQIREDYMAHTYSLFGHRWKGRLSPRLGISHPISDNQMLFLSYGHFSKRPKPQFVYAKLTPAASQSTFQKFGNPDLDPETTVAYELGIQNQFSNDDVLSVTLYYKDIFDYVATKQAKITTSRLTTSNYITYVNQDYARSRGIEVEYRKRVGKWFRGVWSGSYSVTTGKSSTPDQAVLVARGLEDETIKENYVQWDRPWQFNMALTFNVPRGEPLFGIRPLQDLSLYLRLFYQSGKRYSPYIFDSYSTTTGRPIYVVDPNNLLGDVGTYWFWVDMNLEKSFDVFGVTFVASVQVKNLLNRNNAAIINPVTGDAYEDGDPVPSSWNDPRYPQLQAPVSPYPNNPARYLTPRTMILGLTARF